MRQALAFGALMALLAQAPAAQPSGEAGPPKWDARGVGPLPRQPVACVDMSPDGRFVAVGTIAAPGDPSAFILDADGKIVAQHEAGLRFIDQVAVGNAGQFLAAACSTPTGTAGDRPLAFVYAGKSATPRKAELASPGQDPWLFHYGEHSNHLAAPLRSAGDRPVVVTGSRVAWLAVAGKAAAQVHFSRPAGSVVTACAVGAGGEVLVGCTSEAPRAGKPAHNLLLVAPGRKAPLWSRPVCTDVEPAPAMEPARFGPPAPVLAPRKVYAPLAVALDADGRRIAAADYQGWARRGVRMMPTRPTVRVYDRGSKRVRRFGPECFARPFWCELAFAADGRSVFVWPHNWTSRGLAGQAILPAADDARTLYVLDLGTGKSRSVELPAAISSVAHSAGAGTTAVACWNGRAYLLDASYKLVGAWAKGVETGAAALVRISRDGRRVLAAGTDGVVRMLDAAGKELWLRDLNRSARQGEKPWTKKQKAGRLAEGIWRTNGSLAHSDMGSQYLIEAPEGLILIEANSGHSFEQNWARIRGAGFDPMKVRYVLLTHEHGDHAPGAYLWRVVTGAQVVASPQTAYVLQHCLPDHTGYGFHPPNPVDVVVAEDRELKLAGLAVRAVRTPSHTWGSTTWVFRKAGKTYAATGDLIMPGGTLGYDGSVDFSGRAVLESLRKLAAMDLDVILGGHGGGPAKAFLREAIRVGEATGWGRTPPEKPDPLHGFATKDYLVAAWQEKIRAAAFGDVDGDGRPDVAVLTAAAGRDGKLTVKIYLNDKGSFGAKGLSVDVPDPLRAGYDRLLMARVNEDKVADLFVHCESPRGRGAVLLMSRGPRPEYRPVQVRDPIRTSGFYPADLNGDGRTDLILLNRFAGDEIAYQSQAGSFRCVRAEWRNGMDLRLVDVNADGKADVVTSAGDVLLRRPDGSLDKPFQLEAPKAWTWVAAGDFNKDGRTELALLTQADDQNSGARMWVFDNTGDAKRPFAAKPARRFAVPGAAVLRCGPTVADYNGDGVVDVILPASGRVGAVIVLGRPGRGLDPKATVRVRFDYQVHHDTPTGVADFNGDGKADLASFGHSHRTVPGVFIRLQKAR